MIFFFISYEGKKDFHVLKTTTDQYITCENAAKQLQDVLDYLTEQVRLYVATGQQMYMDLYFEEANVTMRRDHALENLQKSFGGTDIFDALQKAMDVSLSVGVAFTDRENPGDSLFKDADKALYKTKENGKCGCSFY